MNRYYGIAAVIILLIVLGLRYDLRRHKRPPSRVIFEDHAAKKPADNFVIVDDDQISCRMFGSHEVLNLSVYLVPTIALSGDIDLTIDKVRQIFLARVHRPDALYPFPPQLIPYFMTGLLAMPREWRGKIVVFPGIIWRYAGQDESHYGKYVEAIAVDKKGRLTRTLLGPKTLFGADHVFVVHRLQQREPYYGLPLNYPTKVA